MAPIGHARQPFSNTSMHLASRPTADWCRYFYIITPALPKLALSLLTCEASLLATLESFPNT